MRTLWTLFALVALVGCEQGLTLSNNKLPGSSVEQAANTQAFAQALRQGRPLIQVGIAKTEANTLAFQEGRRRGVVTYKTPEGIAVLLSGSLLFGTKGLGGDILASDIRESIAMVKSRRGGIATRFHTFIDGEDRTKTRSYVCEVINDGAREISVSSLTGEFVQTQTVLMREDCQSLDQEFSNLYWISRSSGRIVQSRQWAGETTEHLLLRIVIP